jgi:hypothetical protein
MNTILFKEVNDLIAKINGNSWNPPSDWNSVPHGFATRGHPLQHKFSPGGHGKKYWKTYSQNQKILYLFGPLDFVHFDLPDTVVHQTLREPSSLHCSIAFMEIPEKKLKSHNKFPSNEYLQRFQGIFASVFRTGILPCREIDGEVKELIRMELLLDKFSPIEFKMDQKHHDFLNDLAEEAKHLVIGTVKKQKEKGPVFKDERDVERILESVLCSLFTRKGFTEPKPKPKFKGLWRSPKSDHLFTQKGNQWPKKVFVEMKCNDNPKVPLVQVSENLATGASTAVLQIRVPSKPTKEPEFVSEAKKRMEESLAVRYVEVEGW